jgi:sporulation protein YlmC with PRC-barrel domain
MWKCMSWCEKNIVNQNARWNGEKKDFRDSVTIPNKTTGVNFHKNKKVGKIIIIISTWPLYVLITLLNNSFYSQ